MHKKNLSIALIGTIILAIGIILAYFVLKGPQPYVPLILDVISIRSVGNNSIEKAKIIDDMDNHITKIQNKDVINKWDELTNCFEAGCSDETIFDFILSILISHPKKITNAKLMADIIVVGRFWGSGEVLKFSKALTASNEAIESISSKEIDRKWEQIVACKGICADNNNLIFDEIRLIAQQEIRK